MDAEHTARIRDYATTSAANRYDGISLPPATVLAMLDDAATARKALGEILYYFENHVSPFECEAEITVAHALLDAAPAPAAPGEPS